MTSRSLLGIAGTESGSGKTLVTMGFIRAFRNRELDVQPFKVGPDFIDPLYHEAMANRPSVNLDRFFMPEATVRETLEEYLGGADLGLVEGVMGLYDGKSGEPGRYSTAELFRELDVPYVLVVNAAGQSHSIAAKIKGFVDYDDRLECLGVVLTRVASDRHDRMLKRAIDGALDLPVLGSLRDRESLRVPSRHLGLDTAFLFDDEEDGLKTSVDESLASELSLPDGFDERDSETEDAPGSVYGPPADPEAVIGVARDDAFHFYYDYNLRLLREAGARLIPVSPLRDKTLPDRLDGLYIGGGYPEQFAEDLLANRTFIDDLRRRLESGLVTMAECGGLMYLSRQLVDRSGNEHEMVGWFDLTVHQENSFGALGYVEGTSTEGHPFLPPGVTVKGHEFHYSRGSNFGGVVPAVQLEEGTGLRGEGTAGMVKKNTVGSYVHWHFGAARRLADGFVGRSAARTLRYA